MAEQQRNQSGPARKPARRKRRRRSSGAKAAAAVLYVIVVIGAAAVLATLGWTWANDLLALNKESAAIRITISEDYFYQMEQKNEEGITELVTRADMDKITLQLKEAGVIEYEFLFKLFSWFSSADTKIVEGTYELDTNMDYRALVANMSSKSATRQTVNVTIPEGYTIDQIFQLLEEHEVSTVEKLRDTAANYPYKWEFLQDIPLGDYHRLEGYLFPDTYTFYTGHDPVYALNTILNQFHQKMKEFYDVFETEECPYTLHEIVIMASLIEKETDGHDHATIASVLYNRLQNPEKETAGFLQIDATLVYINGGRAPTALDKAINSPYNTYLYKGLPAGAISNPGMESLYAAIAPKTTKYYYYVLNPETMRHEFTKSYSEHQTLVDKYADQ